MSLIHMGIIGFVISCLVDLAVIFVVYKGLKRWKPTWFGLGWENRWHGEHELHTLPRRDLVMHEFEDCACSPRTVPVPVRDGSGVINWQVIHNALDGRK